MKYLNCKKRLFSRLVHGALSITLFFAAPIAKAVIVTPDLEVLTIPAVGNTPQTVNLQNTYTSAIPVCTYNISSSTPVPSVVRIDNITANSFDVYIQKASNSASAEEANDVHCVISDTGEFTVGGMHWEAGSHTPNVTSGRGNFGVKAADTVIPAGTFTSPVVLHQVISSNDADWSASWTYSNSSSNPPTPTNIHIGKHIAHDSDTTRADETVGYIIVETASGTENGVSFDAALGADTIDGVDNDGNTYTAPTIDYRHGIASLNAMDGGDGGWAVLFGASPLAGSAIDIAIDEDDIGDSERSHTTEQVAYWLFEPVDVADLDVVIDDASATYTPGTASVYSITITNQGPNDASTVNLQYSAPTGTSISSWSCAGASCPAASGSGNINETAATLLNTDTLVYTVNLDIPSDQTGDVISTATVSNSNTDPVSANDISTDTNSQSSSADIVVSNDDSSASYTPGTTVQYTLTVMNNGPSDASAVNVVNAAPAGTNISNWVCAGMDCAIASGTGDINETLAVLASGASVIYTVDVDVPSDYTGDLVNIATTIAAEPDPDAGNNSETDTDTQSSLADIAVSNTNGQVSYLPGTTVVYNVIVSNAGPSDASNIAISDAAPTGTTIPAWSCSGASCPSTSGSGDVTEIVPTLVAGDSVSYSISVSVPFSYSGNLVNTASANAVQPDPIAINNAVTDTDTVSSDSDGDGVPDSVEIMDGTDPNNPNDFKDSDGDGVPDLVESAEGTDPNDPDSILDSDGDNTSDYIERGGDKDSDGIGDEFESSITDTDGNNIKDDLDTDADGDGVTDSVEGLSDSDGDGIPDFLDRVTGGNAQGGDSDNDGNVDATECVSYPSCADTDGDSVPNYADSDDDNDSILTSLELGSGGGVSPADSDADTVFDYLEANSLDTDGDGIFNHLDADDDGDGLATVDELDADTDLIGDALSPDDLDNEGIPDYLDADNGDGSGTDVTGSGDSDGDGMSDAQECPTAPVCTDSDDDGIPNYMIANTDSDGDGLQDAIEIGIDPANPIDSDGDNVPDYLEPNGLDTDGDGVLNYMDADDDGDGIDTKLELGSGGAMNPADSDKDGVPDYLSETKIQTGIDGGAAAVNPLFIIIAFLFMMIRNVMMRTVVLRNGRAASIAKTKNFFTLTLVAIFSSLYSGMASASEETIDDIHDPYYIGLGIGVSFLKPETNSVALTLSQDSDIAYRAFGGYQFNDNWVAEIFWSEMGQAEISSGPDVIGTVEYQSFGVGALYQYPVTDSLDVFATGGVGRLRNKSNFASTEKVEDSFVYAGAGVMWSLAETWDLRAEYDYYDSDAQMLSVNLVKRFGSATEKRIKHLEDEVEQQNDAINSGSIAAASVTAVAVAKQKTCDEYAVELKGVEFESQSIELTETSKGNLDAVSEKLKTFPNDVHFEVRAHTDDSGTELYNYSLSLARARNVRDYLATRGIELDRIDAQGYGEWRPRMENTTPEGKKANRRAELVILGLEKYVEDTGTCPAGTEADPVHHSK